MNLNELLPIDIHFARLMERLSAASGHAVNLAAGLLSAAVRQGHICIDLRDYTGADYPDQASWKAALLAATVVGRPGDERPLILDGSGRLYLKRYFDYEARLAAGLKRLAGLEFDLDEELLGAGLNSLFVCRDDPDWQQIAAVTALKKGLAVITGGPGTGKTTTVAAILALLLEQDADLKIALAAPTGKAADRLLQSIRSSKERLGLGDPLAGLLPDAVSTLHRLLRYRPYDGRFGHDRERLLPHDVVVVDEASMVPLSLMSRLVDALKPGARLILLGDKDQLASVEAGYVLGDICAGGRRFALSAGAAGCIKKLTGFAVENGPTVGIRDSLVELEKTWRFSAGSLIGQLSTAVNAGDADACRAILHTGGDDLEYTEIAGGLAAALRQKVLPGVKAMLQAPDALSMLAGMDRLRVLCALRKSPLGSEAVNRLIEDLLAAEGLIGGGAFYHGRPVIIRQNDYNLRLFNGDVGVIRQEDGAFQAFFRAGAGVRTVPASRLPDHETCYAMTVHSSQGSEFEHVIMILPQHDSAVLTRELVYTGITRARGKLEIWAAEDILLNAVSRRTGRNSGLDDALWGV